MKKVLLVASLLLGVVVVGGAQQIINAPNVPAFISPKGGSAPGGANTDVQCNYASVFAACDTGNLTYNLGSNQLNASKLFATQFASSLGLLDNNNFPVASMTAPTVSAGFGTGPTVTAGSHAMAFEITVGTAPGATGTVALPTSVTGWVCTLQDITNAITYRQNAKTTASAGFTGSGSPTAADKLVGACFGY